MTEQPKSIPSEQVFGTAKRIHLDLEKLNMVDHAAVINMLNTMAQHREMASKFERQQAEEKARQDAMDAAQRAHDARATAEFERVRQEAEKLAGKLILVP